MSCVAEVGKYAVCAAEEIVMSLVPSLRVRLFSSYFSANAEVGNTVTLLFLGLPRDRVTAFCSPALMENVSAPLYKAPAYPLSTDIELLAERVYVPTATDALPSVKTKGVEVLPLSKVVVPIYLPINSV